MKSFVRIGWRIVEIVRRTLYLAFRSLGWSQSAGTEESSSLTVHEGM